MKSGQRKRPPMSEETKQKIREGRLITEKLKAVPEVWVEYDSSAGYPEQIRIAFKRYNDNRRIDLRIWRPMNYREWARSRPGPWQATTQGITITPLYILGSVIKALRQIHKYRERWIQKGPPIGGRIPHRIRIALECHGDLTFVDVRTWVIQNSRYQATEKGLVIPLDLLEEVIEGLEQFARPMREVNPNRLRPRFVAPPPPTPLFDAIYGDADLPADQKIGTDASWD